jgi:hypothetical protein
MLARDIDGGVFIAMSGTESGVLPAQPDEAQISILVSSIVLRAREGDSLRCVPHKVRYYWWS